MRSTTKLATVATVAVTALAGVGCEMEDQGTGSPGQEVPAEDTGGDDDGGLY